MTDRRRNLIIATLFIMAFALALIGFGLIGPYLPALLGR